MMLFRRTISSEEIALMVQPQLVLLCTRLANLVIARPGINKMHAEISSYDTILSAK